MDKYDVIDATTDLSKLEDDYFNWLCNWLSLCLNSFVFTYSGKKSLTVAFEFQLFSVLIIFHYPWFFMVRTSTIRNVLSKNHKRNTHYTLQANIIFKAMIHSEDR